MRYHIDMRMVKIQVNLSKKMRKEKEIDKERALTGESISGFLRTALQERVNKEKSAEVIP